MTVFWLYLLILGAYAPGLYAIYRWRLLNRLPVLAMAFLGLFIFNALGSYVVMNGRPSEFWLRIHPDLANLDFVGMLVGQALLAYICLAHYVLARKDVRLKLAVAPADVTMLYVMCGWVLLTLLLYQADVGDFLLFKQLRLGSDYFSQNSLRQNYYYGLPHAMFYIIGFGFLPILFSIHMVLLASMRGKYTIGEKVVTVLAVALPNVMMGFKSGLTEPFLAALFTYIFVRPLALQHGAGRRPASPIVTLLQRLALAIIAIVPTVWLYIQINGSRIEPAVIAKQIWFRVIGVYSMQMAVLPNFVSVHGYLGGSSWPFFYQFVPGITPVNAGILTARYMYGTPGGTPVPCFAEGYINFGWYGFILYALWTFMWLVAIQELFLLVDWGAWTYSMMMLYAFHAFRLGQESLFSYIIQPTFFMVVFALTVVRLQLGPAPRQIGVRYRQHRAAASAGGESS